MGSFVLFLILEGMLPVFHLENNVSWAFIIYGLYSVEVGSFYAHFWRVLIINGCWILSKAFSASVEIIIWFFSFNLLIWCITLIDLHILKNPCIPGIKLTWSWFMIFLMCCWNLLARILMRTFESMFISGNGLQFSFLCCLCLVLVAGWWQPHRMSLEVFFPVKFFGRVLG